MSQYYEENNPGGTSGGGGQPSGHSDIYGQQVRHQQVSALVPERVSRGVFSTGSIVLTGGSEFVIDFLLRMSRPHHVVARVVMPHGAMVNFVNTLRENLRRYEERFGRIPPLPKADPNAPRPGIQEIYDELKLSEDTMAGAYANACMIGHSPTEFVFDFIANFFPRSSVSSRVYISAPQVPRLLESVEHALNQLKQRQQQMQQSRQAPQNQSGNPAPGTNPLAGDPPPPADDADRNDPPTS